MAEGKATTRTWKLKDQLKSLSYLLGHHTHLTYLPETEKLLRLVLDLALHFFVRDSRTKMMQIKLMPF